MPAGSTYSTIATTTLGSAQSSYTFSSIPSTYTDLILISVAKSNGTADDFRIVINANTSTNYSFTQLYGNGTAAFSNRGSAETNGYLGGVNSSSGSFGNNITHFQRYSNTTVKKTWMNRSNSDGYVNIIQGLWNLTNAITSIEIKCPSNNLAAGSTFTLYGITAA